MEIIDITYEPQIVKTNGKNPFIIDGITFYPDTIQPYKNGYILPIIRTNKKVGNILNDITSGISSAGKWITGTTKDISALIKNSGIVDIATDLTGLINSWNDITGQNKSVNDLSYSQQQQLQSLITNKTNTTGTYDNAQLSQIASILSGNQNDINKYLPYIAIGGLFLILLVLIIKR